MDELHNKLRSKSVNEQRRLIKKYAGGFCTRCYNIPTKKISNEIGEAKLVER